MREIIEGGTRSGAMVLFVFGWPVLVTLLLVSTPAGLMMAYGIAFSGLVPLLVAAATGAICGAVVALLPVRWSLASRVAVSFPIGVAAGLLFLLASILVASGGMRMGMFGTWESLGSASYWSMASPVLIAGGLASAALTALLLASRRRAARRATRYVESRSSPSRSRRGEREDGKSQASDSPPAGEKGR